MIKKKILIITTYPIANAQHGGQKRTKAIYDAYKANFSEVKFMAVYYRGFYPVAGSLDVAVGEASARKIQQSPFTGDIIVSDAIYREPKVRRKVSSLLQGFRPDVIHIEQVYPYLGLKPLLKELGLKPKLIFGSQNVEYSMKEEMLLGLGVDPAVAKAAADQIEGLEHELAADCDLLAAVSTSDLNEHMKMGAVRSVLAPNGIELLPATAAASTYWQNYFEKHHISKKVIFVGSAHPPNWFGFEKMIGNRLGFLPPDTKLFLAGSISDYFSQGYTRERLEDATFWLRAVACGRLSDDSLAALLELCDVVVLPITEGGGSNLKTAEALLSGRKIVATNHAFRSYERYRDLPNLWVTDNPDQFRENLTKALAAPFIARTPEQQKSVEGVKWPNVMKDLVKEVSQL